MFEDSTFESTGRIKTRSRRWMIAALALNGSVLTVLILVPLIYPEALPNWRPLILMEAPSAPSAPPQIQKQTPFHGRSEMSGAILLVPTTVPRQLVQLDDRESLPPGSGVANWDSGPGIPGGVEKAFVSERREPLVKPAPRGPVAVSTGVMQGQLIYRVTPTYPAMGVAMHAQGTVVLEAVISRSGTIENLRVVSGPPILQQAALDAVRQWRYRPYELNSQPVEVETTVNVVFTLGR